MPARSLVAGVPAKIKRSDVDATWTEFAVKSYIETARHHRNGLRRLELDPVDPTRTAGNRSGPPDRYRCELHKASNRGIR